MYDASNGKLYWRHHPNMPKNWNSRRAGTEAFTYISPDGHRKGDIDYIKYQSHRVIWAMVTGVWPPSDMEIDHINGDPSDNRWTNLRLVTKTQNQQNTKIYKTNSSGYKGVCWYPLYNKWVARISYGGKRKHLGYYETSEQAHEAYKTAAAKYHGEFMRT